MRSCRQCPLSQHGQLGLAHILSFNAFKPSLTAVGRYGSRCREQNEDNLRRV